MMTTHDANTTALLQKAAHGLSDLSDLELATWCAFVGDPNAEQGPASPEAVLRTFALLDAQQEIDLRNGDREWHGVFRGFSVHLTRYLLVP